MAEDLLSLQASLARLGLPLSFSPPDTLFADGGYVEGDSRHGPFYSRLDGFFGERGVAEALVVVVNAVPELLRRVELGERAAWESEVWRGKAWERTEQVLRLNQRLSALGVGFEECGALLKGSMDDPTREEMLAEIASLREQIEVSVRERGEAQRARELADGYIESARVALGALDGETLLAAAKGVAKELNALRALRPRPPAQTGQKCACCGREGSSSPDDVCSWCGGGVSMEVERDDAMRILRAVEGESLLDAARRVMSECAGVDVVRRVQARLDDARRALTAYEARRIDALPPEEREAALEAAAGQWRAAQEEARRWNAVATQAAEDLRVAEDKVASLQAMRDAMVSMAVACGWSGDPATAAVEDLLAAVHKHGTEGGDDMGPATKVESKRACVVCGGPCSMTQEVSGSWRALKHRAPCGARCVGGGIDRADARADGCGIRDALARAHSRSSCRSPGCRGGVVAPPREASGDGGRIG